MTRPQCHEHKPNVTSVLTADVKVVMLEGPMALKSDKDKLLKVNFRQVTKITDADAAKADGAKAEKQGKQHKQKRSDPTYTSLMAYLQGATADVEEPADTVKP